MSGSGDERQDRALHRAQRRLMDVDVIDLGGIGGGDGPGDRVLHDALEQPLALGGRHELRIADAGDVPVGMEHDGRRDDRAGQAAAPDFVDAGHMQKPTRRSAFSSVRMAGTRIMAVGQSGSRRLDRDFDHF